MKFTDIFIRRPVLATVVSLVILVVGLRSFSSLQVLEYPHTENGVVTLSDLKFTDIFIRRPVLATVVSLVILVVGLRSFSSLQVLEYPHTENGVVTISLSFPG